MRYGRVLFGVVLALVLIGVLAGVGWYAYNVGVAQGAVAGAQSVPPAIEGGTAPVFPYGGYRPFGYVYPFGFGSVVLACLVPFLFLFLLFGLVRLVFWRPHWSMSRVGGPGMHGRFGWDPSRDDIPPAVQEWHRRLHEQDAPTRAER